MLFIVHDFINDSFYLPCVISGPATAEKVGHSVVITVNAGVWEV